jgi:hypothetical protein
LAPGVFVFSEMLAALACEVRSAKCEVRG